MNTESEPAGISYLFRSEYERLVRYVRRLIDDTAERDGEDIVQDVVIHLFSMSDVTVPIENLAAYLYQSLRNRVIDYLRKRKPGMISLEEELYEGTDLYLTGLIPDPWGNALDELEKKEISYHLFAAIELLSDDEKAVIFETEFEGRSFKELSREWGIPIGTLLARKSRALEKVRQMLIDYK